MEKNMQAHLEANPRGCYNFNAGPAVLPFPVLEKIKEELFDYKGTGMSIMEIGHRTKEFEAVINHATNKVRGLLNVPSNYEILFLQGGARLLFGMIPMNLYMKGYLVDVIHTGEWTKQAIADLKRVAEYRLAGSTEPTRFSRVPAPNEIELNPDASYLHVCANNTIFGTQWKTFPDAGNVPVIVDTTSEIFSRPMDVNKFGMIFASAQKNLGIAGVSIVIIRKDLAARAPTNLPVMLQFREHIEAKSLLNTAPTFPIYVSALVLDWIEQQGGVSVIEQKNAEKAKTLYGLLDQSGGFYTSPVEVSSRSVMNVVFRIKAGDEALESQFVKEAEAAGLKGLKGHRSVGGLRASIYNAQPLEGVLALAQFMKDFAKKNG